MRVTRAVEIWIILIKIQIYSIDAIDSTAVRDKILEFNTLPDIETNIFINLEQAKETLMPLPTKLPQLIVTSNISYRLIYAQKKNWLTIVYLKKATGDMEPLTILNQLLHRLHETKLLLVVQQSIMELQQLQWLFNWCWSHGYTHVMALFAFEATNQLQLQLASYRPFPKVHVISVYSSKDYFRLVVPYDFLGQPIRTPIATDPNSVFRYINRQGSLIYTGTYMKLFLYFIDHYNASIEEVILPPPYPDAIDFNDLIKAMYEDRIDISAHAFFANFDRWLNAFPIHLAIQYLQVPHARPISDSQYLLAPFEIKLWIFIVCYILVVTLCYHFGISLRQNVRNLKKADQGVKNYMAEMNREKLAHKHFTKYHLRFNTFQKFSKIPMALRRKVEKERVVSIRESKNLNKTLHNKERQIKIKYQTGVERIKDQHESNTHNMKPAHQIVKIPSQVVANTTRKSVLPNFLQEINAITSSLLQVFSLLTYSQNAVLPRQQSKQLLLMYWTQVLFGFLVTNLYLTLLTSFLTASIYEPQLNSYADIIASTYSIEMVKSELPYFPDDAELRAKMTFVDYYQLQQHHRQLNNSMVRLVSQWKYDFYAYQQYFLRTPRVRLLHLELWSIVGSFIMPLTSPYNEVLSHLVLNAFDAGLVQKAFHDTTQDGIQAGILRFFDDHEQLFNALDLTYFNVGWAVLGIGCLLGSIVFLMELLVKRL